MPATVSDTKEFSACSFETIALTRSIMADQKDGRSQNQPPTHDQQVKGGQHSHGSEESQPDQSQEKQRQPTSEEASKGGQHSHGGSKKS
jgi:general stress protein YciG